MTVKERVMKRIEDLGEAQLERLEQRLEEFAAAPVSGEAIRRRLDAWEGIFGMLSDPEDYAEFEKLARRRPLFGGRTLELEPDEDRGRRHPHRRHRARE
jgi:hypothetical protein